MINNKSHFRSKLGIHLLCRLTGGARRVIRAHCPVIKLLDGDADMRSALRLYRQYHPQGCVVFRAYTPNVPVDSSPEVCAKRYWSEVITPQLAKLSQNEQQMLSYVEGPNEGETPCWSNLQDTEWFNSFWLHLSPLMAQNGYRPCIGSIPVGNPPGSPQEVEDKLCAFRPALRQAKAMGGSWSYHAYSVKFSTDPGVEYWYSLRYRQFYAIFKRRARDLINMPLILSEGGIDDDGQHSAKPGWQRGSAEQYKQWLQWFDAEMLRDDYVLGCSLFQIGCPENWSSFELEPIADWLSGHLR